MTTVMQDTATIIKNVDEVAGLDTGFRVAHNGYCLTLNSVPVSANEMHVTLRSTTTRKEATAALKDVLQAIMDTADKQGWMTTKRLAAASLATY